MNKNVLILLFVCVTVAAVCGGFFLKNKHHATSQSRSTLPAHTSEQAVRPISIAVIPKGTTHSFWNSVLEGAQQAAKDYNVEVFWSGPEREGDREKQIQIVEDFIVKKVTGIVLAPTDAVALAPVVERAASAKIPVVIIDSDITTNKRVSFVATDNFAGGAL
ncbi:MAG: substrate-binding domain-containing protein, partial [Desulfomonilaceae bacterium]